MHGGISPNLNKLSDIDEIPRPLEDPNGHPLAVDLLWSDPMENIKGYKFNVVRGVSVFFGADMAKETCERLDIKVIFRAHQMMMSGYSMFADRRLCTLFTAPRYQADMPNSGAVAIVDKTGHIGFLILRPGQQQSDQMDGCGSDSGSLYYNREEKGAAKRVETEKKKDGKKKTDPKAKKTKGSSDSATNSKGSTESNTASEESKQADKKKKKK